MIPKICCCLLALLVYVQYLLYLMHMFQLNTYKNNEQSAWNKKNSAILGRHIVYLAVTRAMCSLALPWGRLRRGWLLRRSACC